MEEMNVVGRDGTSVGQSFQVQDLLPIGLAVDQDGNLFRKLFGLSQSEDFKQFVQGSESAGKNDERLREISEPELTHEEVVELKIQFRRDIGIGDLLERQADIQTDGFPAGFTRPEIGGLHDPRAAAGCDDEAPAL